MMAVHTQLTGQPGQRGETGFGRAGPREPQFSAEALSSGSRAAHHRYR
jgi:hypothetical protein